jgi:hypothetical protein
LIHSRLEDYRKGDSFGCNRLINAKPHECTSADTFNIFSYPCTYNDGKMAPEGSLTHNKRHIILDGASLDSSMFTSTQVILHLRIEMIYHFYTQM